MTPHQRRLRKFKRHIRRKPRNVFFAKGLAAGKTIKEIKESWWFAKMGNLMVQPIIRRIFEPGMVRLIFLSNPKPPLGQRTEARRKASEKL